jgi:hypothetical protein
MRVFTVSARPDESVPDVSGRFVVVVDSEGFKIRTTSTRAGYVGKTRTFR